MKIKIFLSDVDGVLTDGGMYYTENGDEFKKFSCYDGMGMKLLQKKGFKVGILTSEDRLIKSLLVAIGIRLVRSLYSYTDVICLFF